MPKVKGVALLRFLNFNHFSSDYLILDILDILAYFRHFSSLIFERNPL